jgi:hypothetical protein
MKEVVFPWEANEDNPVHVWAKGCLSLRDYVLDIKKKPTKKKTEQIVKIVRMLSNKRRNWLICMSKSSWHMRSLYPYICSSWIYTHRSIAEIIEFGDFIKIAFEKDAEAKQKKMDVILNVGLLVIPNIDFEYTGIRVAKGLILNLLLRRKTKGGATLIDLKCDAKPRGLHDAINMAKSLRDQLGMSVDDIIAGENTRYLYVGI